MSADLGALTYDDALCLKRIADGGPVTLSEADRDRLAAAGLIRVVPPADLADRGRYVALQQETERLGAELHRELHPAGIELVEDEMLPGHHRRHVQRIKDLQDRIDQCKSATQAQWLDLSERELLAFDPDLCAQDATGACVEITDAGLEALQELLWSDEFERQHARPAASAARVSRFLALRRALLEKGFNPDPRVDVAAAILSHHETDPTRFYEFNEHAIGDGWRNYDRLPLLAALCRHAGATGDVWQQLAAGYQRLQATDLHGSYDSLYAALQLMSRPGQQALMEITPAVSARMDHVSRHLTFLGWNIGAVHPAAATLVRSFLPTARLGESVAELSALMCRDDTTRGMYASAAAADAVSCDLFRRAPEHQAAVIGEMPSVFGGLVQRYSAIVGTFEAADSRRTVPAMMLALMPGSAEANRGRCFAAVQAISPEVPDHIHFALPLLLCDSAWEDWLDLSYFTWEISCLMSVQPGDAAYEVFDRVGVSALIFYTQITDPFANIPLAEWRGSMASYIRAHGAARQSLTPLKGQ